MTKRLLKEDGWKCINLAKEANGKFGYAGELNLFYRDPMALLQTQYSSGSTTTAANFHEHASITMVDEYNLVTGLKEKVQAYNHPMTCEHSGDCPLIHLPYIYLLTILT